MKNTLQKDQAPHFDNARVKGSICEDEIQFCFWEQHPMLVPIYDALYHLSV